MKRGKKGKKRNYSWIWGVLIFFIVFFALSLTEDSSSEEDELNSMSEKINDSFSNIEIPHFAQMPIAYRINNSEACERFEKEEMIKAFNILSNATNGRVSFIEVEEGEQITIYCFGSWEEENRQETPEEECKNFSVPAGTTKFSVYDLGVLDKTLHYMSSLEAIERNQDETIYEVCFVNKSEAPDFFVGETSFTILGEALPNYKENIIFGGSINLYHRGAKCSVYPSREVHELLHIMIFGHSKEYISDSIYLSSSEYKKYLELLKDIMYPYLECRYQREIQQKYISCLNYIYSNGTYPGDCSEVNLLTSGCSEGWYPAIEGAFCCPEPDMFIDENGYCSGGGHDGCEEGYPTVDGEYCCAEPNMTIDEEGYCA